MLGFGRLATAPPIELDLIDGRLPVWRALADLYLDTFDSYHYDPIATELLRSGLPHDALQEIFRTEVTPAFASNLFLDVAGEWTGWSDEIICETIGGCLAKGANRLLPKRAVETYARTEWEKVAAALDRAAAD